MSGRMAEIRPFRPYHYDPRRFHWGEVLTQPYDKITPRMQERYYASGPYNLIPVEKGRGRPDDTPRDNVYTRAARTLDGWIRDGVLVRRAEPAVFAYSQEYRLPGRRERRRRTALLALGRVVDHSAGVVFRHERTLAAPKADRLELLRRTRAQTGLLFMLYDDPSREVAPILGGFMERPAWVEFRDEDGIRHAVRPIDDPAAIDRLRSAMADKRLVIADGHHRYETALAYRDERRAATGRSDPDAPHEWAMMAFIDARSEGLTVLPTHRVASGVSGFDAERLLREVGRWFDIESRPFPPPARRDRAAVGRLRAALVRAGRERNAVGLYLGGGAAHLLRLRTDADIGYAMPDESPAQRRLDVVLLHRLVLEAGLGIGAEAVAREMNVIYEREMPAAIAAVDDGRAQVCCLLNPARVGQVMEIALAGDVLPQKSTDFYPKLPSGLAVYRIEDW